MMRLQTTDAILGIDLGRSATKAIVATQGSSFSLRSVVVDTQLRDDAATSACVWEMLEAVGAQASRFGWTVRALAFASEWPTFYVHESPRGRRLKVEFDSPYGTAEYACPLGTDGPMVLTNLASRIGYARSLGYAGTLEWETFGGTLARLLGGASCVDVWIANEAQTGSVPQNLGPVVSPPVVHPWSSVGLIEVPLRGFARSITLAAGSGGTLLAAWYAYLVVRAAQFVEHGSNLVVLEVIPQIDSSELGFRVVSILPGVFKTICAALGDGRHDDAVRLAALNALPPSFSGDLVIRQDLVVNGIMRLDRPALLLADSAAPFNHYQRVAAVLDAIVGYVSEHTDSGFAAGGGLIQSEMLLNLYNRAKHTPRIAMPQAAALGAALAAARAIGADDIERHLVHRCATVS